MAVSNEQSNRHSIRFSIGEWTGALGDSVTVLPIIVAIAALTEFSLAHLLLGFAVFQIIWGLYYGLPISVEPMKALAALVIAGTLTAGELVVAGLLVGGILLVVGTTGTLDHLERYISQPVIRGVQVAVALILLETSVHLSLNGPFIAFVALIVAVIVCLVGYRRASALIVLCLGVVFTTIQTGLPTPHLPTAAVTLPSPSTVSPAALEGTAAQLAMTVGNAAVATSLLLSDYYDADVSADDLATSMGAMNMIAMPLGAMPMCHGSGGVAGKYAFGARTAGSNLVLGGLYAVTAVFAVGVVAAFPLPMLGVILALIAVELGRAGLDTDHVPFTLCIGILGVLTNVGLAFGIGILGCLVLKRVDGGLVRPNE